MNAERLLDEILGIIRQVKDDKIILEKILEFLNNEIAPPEEPQFEIPGQFKGVIAEIASTIDAGMLCYLNIDTLETKDVIPDWLNDDTDLEIDSYKDELGHLKHVDWKNSICFEPLDSHESFRIMEQFVSQLKNIPLQNKLILALDNRKPFANFKRIIDNSGEYSQQWFDFKQKQLEWHVAAIMETKLPE